VKPFTQVMQDSWERNLKVWPLFAWQMGIEVLRIVTLIPCLLIVFIPLWKSKADFAGADWSRLSDSLVKLLWQSGWWKLALAMFLLYMVWWLIIEALVNGGIFGRLWAWAGSKEGFSFKEYLRDGLRFFLPLITLHLMTTAIMLLVVGVPAFLIGMAGASARSGAESGAAILPLLGLGLLVAIPAGLVLAVVAVWWLVARGYITSGHPFSESLRLSFRKCMADKGRVFWGLNLMFLLLFVGLMVVSMVFGILQAVPLVGVLFSVVNFLVSTVTTAFLAVFVPSVIVTYLDEK